MVTFHFDAGCPWTWVTSRWLVDEAARRGEPITWRTFSPAMTREGEPVPPQLADAMAMGLAALRIVEALRAADRNDDIGRFYTALGTAVFEERTTPDTEAVAAAATAAGLGESIAAAAEDSAWDDALRDSLAEARALVGDDVGSPVLVFDGAGAFFGPILAARPSPEDAARIWDASALLAGLPEVAELKRGRGIGVTLDPAVGG